MVLAQRLQRLDPKTLGHLSAVFGERLLAVLGPHDWLPWSVGVVYLGQAPDVPGLYLPTTLAPEVPLSLLLTGLQRRFPDAYLPLACLPKHCFSLADAAPLTHAALQCHIGDRAT